ncbi:hypothetical protein TWF696_004615 [Orbilia brochopaga]|uniref:Phosphoglycerate mutase n=1 Tax=Orbilia brochopaga TaxID=3140254 RepID=A0AAV9VD47_9PEZI
MSAPAQIFVCRHGARLDASDSTWHLTSPTPYDPPLTFGGWTQARSLGNRIASHIVSQISSEHPVAQTPAAKPAEKAAVWSAAGKEPKKDITVSTAAAMTAVSKSAAGKLANTRIVIHTSPFLRCVQTSIAVTAGMSQYFSDVAVANSENVASAPEKLEVHPRPMLRIDGFLSEWLCEDYFADITPPPASDLMIGTAKIDLMRPSSAGVMRKDTALPTPTPSHAHQRAHSVGFVPPVPSSAVGKNEPIPRGHVSHARDFLDIDYAYDSLRYGDGGEYGEEWGRMHKRVKVGFEKIVKDYTSGEVKPCLKHSNASHATNFEQLAAATAAAKLKDGGGDCAAAASDEVLGSTIIIFISHGAICNALIGAMTHQPVLMDMGIASMSMGVLLPAAPPPAISPPPPRQSTPSIQLPGFNTLSTDEPDTDDISFPQKSYAPYSAPSPSIAPTASSPQYDVRIVASTDHLRPPASAVKSPQQGGNSGGTGARQTPPLRPRKPSVGGSGFSMYNTIGKLPAPLIGSANAPAGTGSGGGGGGTVGTGLLPTGRAMGMVFGGGGGGTGGHAMGVRRTASAAAATKGLWSLPAAEEMERGSSDEGAVLTDEDSGEDRKEQEEGEKVMGGVERHGSVSGGMWGGGARSGSIGKPLGLWNSNANIEQRRRSTVTKKDEGA